MYTAAVSGVSTFSIKRITKNIQNQLHLFIWRHIFRNWLHTFLIYIYLNLTNWHVMWIIGLQPQVSNSCIDCSLFRQNVSIRRVKSRTEHSYLLWIFVSHQRNIFAFFIYRGLKSKYRIGNSASRIFHFGVYSVNRSATTPEICKNYNILLKL